MAAQHQQQNLVLPLGSAAHMKAREVFDLYAELERCLAVPDNVKPVGKVYTSLLAWQRAHEWDSDLGGVLEFVASSLFDYPSWKRQAMEECYRLFYDDVARQGTSAVEQLPEPPTSEEIGFRTLNEALLSGKADSMRVFPGSYEDRNGFALSKRRWEYEIERVPSAAPGGVSGRLIHSAGHHQDWPINVSLMRRMACQLPVDGCCATRDSARRARGPFLLPEGSRAMPKRPPPALSAFPGPDTRY
mmetsp:Transcript_16176/g.41623  ORF Transcript_16176/g.41623 Transcript_16176/m.41623 type:complete len:245 (-) Transcript_16176:115-849(-)